MVSEETGGAMLPAYAHRGMEMVHVHFVARRSAAIRASYGTAHAVGSIVAYAVHTNALLTFTLMVPYTRETRRTRSHAAKSGVHYIRRPER